MASATKKMKMKKKRKSTAMGKKRKLHIKKYGTTPVFPIHIEEQK